ncbi:MAG: TonB-dependent receptor [Cyclobacteriaceae bacterium]|nr:TonB-dependent receptor [Cyclobacteriaceae bacterium]
MRKHLLTFCLGLLATACALGQGVTNSSITGKVVDAQGQSIPGANIVATHNPSGTTYGTSSLADGRFTIPGMRIGGPYTVKVSFVGYKESVYNDIFLSLGTAANLNVQMVEEATQLTEVVVSGVKSDVFSSDRTGAATNITTQTINTLPTISRSINDFTRLTPQASGQSFIGADARFNNITIDGSSFNNSFGLAAQPGGRTGSTPISLDAIDEIQVNIAPFDVRQAGFVGAGVNAVTRSGTNEVSGSVFYNFRNENFVGDVANGRDVITQNFDVKQYGFRVGGPIVKNKLFFFLNAESERRSDPATSFRSNLGGEPVTGNVTRVLKSDLDALSSFLSSNYGYETGPYESYNNETTSDKFLVKLDYNVNQNHKLSLRYNSLISETDVLASNSNSLGFGNRRTNNNALNYQNTNYIQKESIHSLVAELNSRLGDKMSNQLMVGYTIQNEDRGSRGDFFPLVEIQNASTTYISFGFEPFTPNNKLNYKTFQLQDNFTYYMGKHTLTAGFNLEHLQFENVFFPGSQSVYVYNSLADWYAATDANPANDPTLRRFQLRYSALPGGAEPVQPTKVTYMGVYLQDEFEPIKNLNITAGLRVDVPKFADTGFANSTVETLTFRDPDGNPYSINTKQLPKSTALISPRLGFNYDVFGNRSTQVRGGTGLFTGRPVFVWISNQIGNNGVLTGFEELNNTTLRPFNPDPTAYIPATPTLPSSVELAATDPDFKFPQVWRTNIAVDQKLPFGLVGTLEFIYSQDVNGITYFNANLPAAQSSFGNPDGRLQWTQNRLYPSAPYTVTSAEVLTNTNKGYSQSFAVKIEKPLTKGFYAMAAYNFGRAKNIIDPGSIARGSWTNNPIVFDPNNAPLAYNNQDQRHRVIATASYRKEYLNFGATQISLFWEGRNQGRYSYRVSNDMNGDGANNDLIYIPRDQSDMIFETYTPTGASAPYTATQQAADWDAFINQDPYLSKNRGDWAERNGALLPWVFRADLSIAQEFFLDVNGKRNTLQVRADIINFGNMLSTMFAKSAPSGEFSKEGRWGVGEVPVTTQPLNYRSKNAAGQPVYRLVPLSVTSGVVNPITQTFQSSTTLADVWQMQFSIRYIFN